MAFITFGKSEFSYSLRLKIVPKCIENIVFLFAFGFHDVSSTNDSRIFLSQLAKNSNSKMENIEKMELFY
jgi:hypothetical protein